MKVAESVAIVPLGPEVILVLVTDARSPTRRAAEEGEQREANKYRLDLAFLSHWMRGTLPIRLRNRETLAGRPKTRRVFVARRVA